MCLLSLSRCVSISRCLSVAWVYSHIDPMLGSECIRFDQHARKVVRVVVPIAKSTQPCNSTSSSERCLPNITNRPMNILLSNYCIMAATPTLSNHAHTRYGMNNGQHMGLRMHITNPINETNANTIIANTASVCKRRRVGICIGANRTISYTERDDRSMSDDCRR
jgi:hypothetical protein